MKTENKPLPPELEKPPKRRVLPPRPGSKPNPDKSIGVRIVTDYELDALLFNIATMVVMFVTLSIGLRNIKPNPSLDGFLANTIPLIAIWIFFFFTVKKWGTNVDSREAKVYLNYLRPRLMIAYLQGFHFTTWCSKIQEDPISFQKDQKIAAKKANNTEIKIRSQDGYDMYVDIYFLYNRRDTMEGLSKSLRYRDDEIREWALAVVSERLSDLAGCNSAETLIYYKTKVIRWVGLIFGGERVISDFEDQTGTDINNPVLEVIDLTPEAQKIFSTRSRIAMVNEGIKALREANPDMHVNEASRTAQAAEGIATREIKTFEAEGLENAQTVVLGGDSGFAVTGREKGKK